MYITVGFGFYLKYNRKTREKKSGELLKARKPMNVQQSPSLQK